MAAKYGLVCEVSHERDIRGVAAFPAIPNSFLTASRDFTVKLWIDNGGGDYQATVTLAGHEGDVYGVTYVKGEGDRKAAIATASRDKNAILWDIDSGSPVHILSGHESDVVCIDASPDGGRIVTGSYDKKAIVWDSSTGKKLFTLQGDNAIRCVKFLSNGTILTGGDNKQIAIWSNDGKKIKDLRNHKSTIRGFTELPIGFASASSDENIMLWTATGDHLMTLSGHASMVYSVAALPGSDLVSASEDATAKVWSNGECTQTITHCTTVWGVCVLDNGDFVTGCADNFARVWSTDQSRVKEQLETTFKATVASKPVATKAVGGVELGKLPGPEALAQDGTSEGQVRMIKRPDYPTGEVYTWSAIERKWNKTGDLMDDPNEVPEKKMLNGVYYDHVIDVAVDDGTPEMRLGVNNGENEWEAAQRFVLENADRGVRQDHLAQVAEFIAQNVGSSNVMEFNANQASDPLTGGSRYIPGAGGGGGSFGDTAVSEFAKEAAAMGDAGTESYRDTYKRLQGQQVAVSAYAQEALRLEEEARQAAGRGGGASALLGSEKYPLTQYCKFQQPVNSNGCMKKINEFNTALAVEQQLNEQQQNTLTNHVMASVSQENGATVNPADAFPIVIALFNFPPEKRFPAVDVLRVLVKEENTRTALLDEYNNSTTKGTTILGNLLSFFSGSASAAESGLICKVWTNLIASDTAATDAFVVNNLNVLLDNAKIVFKMTPNARTALSSLVHNLAVLLSKQPQTDEGGAAPLAEIIGWLTQWLLYESAAVVLTNLLCSTATLLCEKSTIHAACRSKAKECYLRDCLKGKTQFGDSAVMSLAAEVVEKFLE